MACSLGIFLAVVVVTLVRMVPESGMVARQFPSEGLRQGALQEAAPSGGHDEVQEPLQYRVGEFFRRLMDQQHHIDRLRQPKRDEGLVPENVYFWIHICRKTHGDFLYHPMLTSLRDSLRRLGAHVRMTHHEDMQNMTDHINSTLAAGEQHWVVTFPLGPHADLPSCYSGLYSLSQLGARVVLYQTEPDVLEKIPKVADAIGASEVWDYSQRNIQLYNTSAVKRFVPPHYAPSMDFGVDLQQPPANGSARACFFGAWGRRPESTQKGFQKVFGRKGRDWTLIEDFDVGNSTPEHARQVLSNCPISFNLHAGAGGGGRMEAFRLAMLLANKVCILSEGVHEADRREWQDLVLMPPGEEGANRTNWTKFHELYDRARSNLTACRESTSRLYRERFSGERVLKSAGVLEKVRELALEVRGRPATAWPPVAPKGAPPDPDVFGVFKARPKVNGTSHKEKKQGKRTRCFTCELSRHQFRLRGSGAKLAMAASRGKAFARGGYSAAVSSPTLFK